MNILLIHQNFPGQFKYLAPRLSADSRKTVVALTMRKDAPVCPGITLVPYAADRGSAPHIHPWLADLETKTIRAEACFRACRELAAQGFRPDVIVAHSGWGESLFVKDVWPRARLGIYCEFYYRADGADVGFDPEFASADPGEACRLRLKNLNNMLHFEIADAGLAPTAWQAGTYPQPFRDRITVVHDGIDTDALAPNPNVSLSLGSGLALTKRDEVITFVNRNLEPYRGYHIFMRALPAILRQRPRAHVMIVGGNGTSYGAKPKDGLTWRDVFLQEVRGLISDADWSRVHFLGTLPYPHFVALLQLSTVHVYLTYPFILSWSLLEAMSLGCAVVASDTAPVREAVRHDETGRLVPFFDIPGLVSEICRLLDDPAARDRLGRAARALARTTYDVKTVCLPRQLQWVDRLADTLN